MSRLQIFTRSRVVHNRAFSRVIVCVFAVMFVVSTGFMIKYERYLRSDTAKRKAAIIVSEVHTTAVDTTTVVVETHTQRDGTFAIPPTCIHPPIETHDLAENETGRATVSGCVFSHDLLGRSQTSFYDFKTARCNVTELIQRGVEIVKWKTSRFDVGSFKPVDLYSSSFAGSDFYMVSCDNTTETYVDIHAKIAPRMDAKPRNPETKIGVHDRYKYNVIILAISSVSRAEFSQNFPLSRKYFVEQLDGVVLEAYNALGRGSTSELLHLLTGRTDDELVRSHQRGRRVTADSFPWIWQNFKHHGYVTQAAIDVADISSFTYSRNGFADRPTDHYIKPYFLAKSRWNIGYSACDGSKLDVTLNWLRHFFTQYRRAPKFSFTFLSDMINDSFFRFEDFDNKLRDTFVWFRSHEHADNTVFILTTDAPAFTSPDSENIDKRDHLPFLGVYLPKIFRRSHRLASDNLQKNAFRLTTPLDIHSTMMNLITPPIRPAMADLSTRAVSLFREVPTERSCAQAAVHPSACQCMVQKTISPASAFGKGAIKRTITYINTLIGPVDKDCAKLALDSLTRVTRYDTHLQTMRYVSGNPKSVTYVNKAPKSDTHIGLHFTTVPGNASFEVIALYQHAKKNLLFDRRQIIRLNNYGNASNCALTYHFELRHICYCI